MTKAAATVPTPPRVTRSQKNSDATGDVPNTKNNEDRIDTENDNEKKIAGDKNPTGTEDVLGENNKTQFDGADKGDDEKKVTTMKIKTQKAKQRAPQKGFTMRPNRKSTVPKNLVTNRRCRATDHANQRRSTKVSCISNFHALISILTNVLSLQTR